MDLDALQRALDKTATLDPRAQQHMHQCEAITTKQLSESLPAIPETDLAAVAFYIAQMLTAIRDLPIGDGDVITDTACGYALTAARLIGML